MLKFLKRYSRLKLKKEPNICNAEMVGPQDTLAYLYLTRVKGIITFQFAGHNMKVCKDWGITEEKKGFGGNKKFRALLCEESRVLWLFNKRWRGIDQDKKLSKRFIQSILKRFLPFIYPDARQTPKSII